MSYLKGFIFVAIWTGAGIFIDHAVDDKMHAMVLFGIIVYFLGLAVFN